MLSCYIPINLTLKRNILIKDYMHKVSRLITSYCIIYRIDTVVIGKNKQNKNKINKDIQVKYLSIKRSVKQITCLVGKGFTGVCDNSGSDS
jgi:IS605 OrfB family transposase